MEKIFNLIIADESGSMCVIAREALAGLNETLSSCRQMQEKYPDMEQCVTLVTFDSDHYKMHYDNVPAVQTETLAASAYQPGGATPLYDAIGKGIARIMAQAETNDKVLVTIITDGEENCSKEYNLTMVKRLIEKQKEAGWTFSLIGTENLDVEGMANSMAIDNHLCFPQDEEGTKAMFIRENNARARFNQFCCMNASMPKGSLFEEDE